MSKEPSQRFDGHGGQEEAVAKFLRQTLVLIEEGKSFIRLTNRILCDDSIEPEIRLMIQEEVEALISHLSSSCKNAIELHKMVYNEA